MSKLETITFDASEAKNSFGKLLDAAQRQPVAIKRHGRRVAFVISPADMEAIEDLCLGLKATAAMKQGKWLGVEESERYLKSILKKKRHAAR